MQVTREMMCRSGPTYVKVLKVNVVGVFITTKAFVPLLKKKQTRTIVQLSSIFASVSFNRLGMTEPQKNPAGDKLIAYNASKAAVNMRKCCTRHIHIATVQLHLDCLDIRLVISRHSIDVGPRSTSLGNVALATCACQ